MSLDGTQFNHYHILQLLGKGDMGEVYLAEDLHIQRLIAIKVVNIEAIQPDQRAGVNALYLFLRETTALASFEHANIQPYYNHGEVTLNGSRFVYLIMPYQPEGSLMTWLHQRAQKQPDWHITPQQVVHIIRQAGSALQYAHEHQVMHQGVKPTNLLIHSRSTIDEYPNLLLSDFGIARLASAVSDELAYGEPTYLAPEQFSQRPAFASDQYALGVIAYELLTSHPPFQGTPEEVMAAHLQDKPGLVRDLMPLLPPAVDLVLQRVLAKKPKRRFPSVAAFTQALQIALQSVPAAALRHAPVFTPQLPNTPMTTEAISATPDDLRVTLTISAQEARDGTVRTLALPNERRVNVQIPAGAQAEQVLMLSGQGDTPATGGAPGNLYLKLEILQTQAQVAPSLNDMTIPIRNFSPTRALASARLLAPAHKPFTSLPAPSPDTGASLENTLPAPAPGESRRARSPILVVAMLLLVLTGGGLGAYSAITTNGPLLQTILRQSNPPGPTAHTSTNQTRQATTTPRATATPKVLTPSQAWHAQPSGTSKELISVTWADTQFVVVGDQGAILTSLDGLVWTIQNSGTTQTLQSVAWSGSLLVAVGSSGAILTSPDGRVWTVQHSGTTQDLWSIVWGDGSLFVVTGTGGTILTSPDGHTWTARNSGTGQILDGITWSGKLYTVVGDNGTVLTSPDTSSWTIQNSHTSQLFESIAWLNAQFVIVGASGTILTSPDGNAWTAQHSGVTQSLYASAWSGSLYTIIGDQGTILTSPDGRAWTVQHSGTTQRLWGILRQGALFVAVGDKGTILTSP